MYLCSDEVGMLVTTVVEGLARMHTASVVQCAVNSANNALKLMLGPVLWQFDGDKLSEDLMEIIDEGVDHNGDN